MLAPTPGPMTRPAARVPLMAFAQNGYYSKNPLVHRDRRLVDHVREPLARELLLRRHDASSSSAADPCARRPSRSSRDGHPARTACCSPRRTRIVYRARLARAARIPLRPEHVHHVRRLHGRDQEERSSASTRSSRSARSTATTHLRGLRLHGRGRRVRAQRSRTRAPLRRPRSKRVRRPARRTRPSARRSRGRRLGDPGRRRRSRRARCSAEAPRRGGARGARQEARPRAFRSMAAPTSRTVAADALLHASYAGRHRPLRRSTSSPRPAAIEAAKMLVREHPGQPHPPQGDRRRRRQGAAHRREARRAVVPEHGSRHPRRGEGHSASATTRTSSSSSTSRATRHNEIQLVGNGEWCVTPRRSRLLAADARAEAGRGVDHAGGSCRPRWKPPLPRGNETEARRCSPTTSPCSPAWSRRPSASASRWA